MDVFTFPNFAGCYFLFFTHSTAAEKRKKRQEMLRKLAKGDRVLTRGGIWGVVVGVRQEEGLAVVKIAENVKVEVAIQAIDLVNPSPEEAKAGGEENISDKSSRSKSK